MQAPTQTPDNHVFIISQWVCVTGAQSSDWGRYVTSFLFSFYFLIFRNDIRKYDCFCPPPLWTMSLGSDCTFVCLLYTMIYEHIYHLSMLYYLDLSILIVMFFWLFNCHYFVPKCSRSSVPSLTFPLSAAQPNFKIGGSVILSRILFLCACVAYSRCAANLKGACFLCSCATTMTSLWSVYWAFIQFLRGKM